MPLSQAERSYVIDTAVRLLKHRRRDRLLDILARRLQNAEQEYPDERERDLDQIAYAIARTIDEQLDAE